MKFTSAKNARQLVVILTVFLVTLMAPAAAFASESMPKAVNQNAILMQGDPTTITIVNPASAEIWIVLAAMSAMFLLSVLLVYGWNKMTKTESFA